MILRHLTAFSSNHGRISKGALERLSSTSLPETTSSRREKHIVLTLDPNKFAEKNQQRLHIGSMKNLQVFTRNQSSSMTLVQAPRLIYDMTNMSGIRRILYYPPNTKAFLYYFASPKRPRIAGELRFRVASSDDHASFQTGSDLLKSDGQIWSRPLHVLPERYSPLYETLKEDKLIPDDLDAVLLSFPSISPRYSHRTCLYTLNDPFIVDFSGERTLYVITEKGMENLPFKKPFTLNLPTPIAPYTGSALVRFEHSTIPESKGTRTVVLRILKIITPVTCVLPSRHYYNGDIVQPKEGELYRRCSGYKDMSNPRVWSVNIDKEGGTMSRGLQLLWDA